VSGVELAHGLYLPQKGLEMLLPQQGAGARNRKVLDQVDGDDGAQAQ
jgi:hypothetical protein